MAVQPAPWVGRQLSGNRYQIRAALGEGGMGIVYRAWDRNLETEVVIKVPRLSMLEEPGFVERFSREIRSLVKLTHPHIVKVLDVGSQDGIPFAVMQYLSGGSLESRRQSWADSQGRCPAGSLAGWLSEIAQALDFLHSQGFLHRDVKPANILFDGHNNAYLSDFGVIKALSESDRSARSSSLTGTGMVLGTPRYMAPEMVTGEAVDGRADQYALGVVVYELLAGRAPVDGPTPTAVLVAQTTQQPVPLAKRQPNVSPGLSQAVMRCLSKRRADRFATCGELASAVLAGVDRREMPPAPAPSPAARPVDAGSAVPPRCSAVAVGATPCPVCQAKLNLQPEHAGKRLRCRGCRTPLAVSRDFRELREVKAAVAPDLGATNTVDTDGYQIAGATQELAALDLPEPPRTAPTVHLKRSLPPPKQLDWQPRAAIGSVAAVLAVVLGGVAYWALRGGENKNAPAPPQSPLAQASPTPSAANGPTRALPSNPAGDPPQTNRSATTAAEIAAAPDNLPVGNRGEAAPNPNRPDAQADAAAQLTPEQQERIRRAVATLMVRRPDGTQIETAAILLEKPRVLVTHFLPIVGAEAIEVAWADGTREPVAGFYDCRPRLNLALLAPSRTGANAPRGVPLASAPPGPRELLLMLDPSQSQSEAAIEVRIAGPLSAERLGSLLAEKCGTPWGPRAFRQDAPWLVSEAGQGGPGTAGGWFNQQGELVAWAWPAAEPASVGAQLALAVPPCLPDEGAWDQPRNLADLPLVSLLVDSRPTEPLTTLPLAEEKLNLAAIFPRDLGGVRDRLAKAAEKGEGVVTLVGAGGAAVAYFSYANDVKGQSRLEGDCLLLADDGAPLLLCQYERGMRNGIIVLLREDGSCWLAQQMIRGKPHGWSVLYHEQFPWVIRSFRNGVVAQEMLLHDGWLASLEEATRAGALLTGAEENELAAAIGRAEDSVDELSNLIYDGFQEIRKDALKDRVRSGQVQARASSRDRAEAIHNLKQRLDADYSDAKRRILNGK